MEPASFFRRMLAMVYDGLLLLGVLFLASVLLLLINHGEAIQDPVLFKTLKFIYFIVVCGVFYTWFWKKNGQTLGMQMWRLKIVNLNQSPLTWKQLWIRYFGSIISVLFLGLGYFWILIDPGKRALHDIWADSIVVDLRY